MKGRAFHSDNSSTTPRGEDALWVEKRRIAEIYGVCPRVVDDWIKQRLIPHRKYPSGMVRLNPAEVEKALAKFDIHEVTQ